MPTILLVEDESPGDEVIAMRLRKRGFDVVIANDGLTGIAMAEANLPDLILMDWRMPGIDGLEATKRLKTSTTTTSVPVIILSASVMPSEREQAFAAGCDEMEEKPVDFVRLTEKINSLLNREVNE